MTDLGPVGDDAIEDRKDGEKSTGPTASRIRQRSTEPLPLSIAELLATCATWAPLWELAEEIDELVGVAACGRPRGITAVELLIIEIASWEYRSYRNACRQLADSMTWRWLQDAVIAAHPDRPGRRLSSRPPSRQQHQRLRALIVAAGVVEVLGERLEAIAAAVSRDLGMFDQKAGSLTHPAANNVMVGDGTWLPAIFKRVVDGSSQTPRRHDADAYGFHDSQRSAGHMLVFATSRTEHPHERVLHSIGYKPQYDMNDAAVFTDMVLALQPRLPGLQAIVYDMALHAKDVDTLMNAGIITVSKVARTAGGAIAHRILGDHEFELANGDCETLVVHAADGSPLIKVIAKGEQYVVVLDRVRLKRRPTETGNTTYGEYRVPDVDGVPPRLRGATTWVRLSSTTDEVAGGRRRTRHLRPVPECDPDFAVLYGRRQDAESVNNHVKERLHNGRARCVGQDAIRLNLFGYQIRTMVVAIVANQRRTGRADQHWFGKSPPGAAAPVAA